MAKRKKQSQQQAAGLPNRVVLLMWLLLFGGLLFFLPVCADWYLAPRFLYAAVVSALGFWWMGAFWMGESEWRFNGFDLLLAVWYGWNLASVFWAHEYAEAVFQTQKASLLLFAYAVFRYALQRYGNDMAALIFRITHAAAWVLGLVVAGQLMVGYMAGGLDNEVLYDYAIGLNGNKTLASEFLFLLMGVQWSLLYTAGIRSRRRTYVLLGWLFVLVVLMQTRSVYLSLLLFIAVYAAYLLYAYGKEAKRYWRQVLLFAVAVASFVLLAVWVGGKDSSLAQRLNPATYLESASAAERRFIWYKTGQLNQEHFWTGVGNGNWKIWIHSQGIEGGYRLQEKNITFTRAHNDYLEVRSELGIIGLALFAGMFLFVLVSLLWAGDQRTGASLWGTLAGYMLIQALDFPRERIEFHLMLALLFALSVWQSPACWKRTRFLFPSSLRRPVLALAALVLAFNVVVGYYRVEGAHHQVLASQAWSQNKSAIMAAEARKASNIFYKLDDVASPPHWYEGLAYLSMQQPEKAAKVFAMAHEIHPWNLQVLNDYASSLLFLEKYREAIPLLEQAVRQNPRYEEAKLNLVFAHLKLNDLPEAKAWLERIAPRDTTTQHSREILEKKRNYERMIAEENQ